MIRFVRGDLFKSKAQTLTNAVNCVGVMGKGVALAFRERFPVMYEEYRLQCQHGKIHPGVLTIHKNTNPWVLNFPTKQHWKGKSQLRFIELGLRALVQNYKEWGLTSLAMPALGCGYGGLDWAEVRPLMERYLADLDINVEVYEPQGNTNQEADKQPFYSSDLFGNSVSAPQEKKVSRRRKGKSF